MRCGGGQSCSLLCIRLAVEERLLSDDCCSASLYKTQSNQNSPLLSVHTSSKNTKTVKLELRNLFLEVPGRKAEE